MFRVWKEKRVLKSGTSRTHPENVRTSGLGQKASGNCPDVLGLLQDASYYCQEVRILSMVGVKGTIQTI